MIEDTSSMFKRNFGNGILIPSYCGGSSDEYLLKLMDYLSQLKEIHKETGTIRHVDKQGWYYRTTS